MVHNHGLAVWNSRSAGGGRIAGALSYNFGGEANGDIPNVMLVRGENRSQRRVCAVDLPSMFVIPQVGYCQTCLSWAKRRPHSLT